MTWDLSKRTLPPGIRCGSCGYSIVECDTGIWERPLGRASSADERRYCEHSTDHLHHPRGQS